MNIFGCFDWFSFGSYYFVGYDVVELDSDEQVWLCCEVFGFVFQGYYLIFFVLVQENVEMLVIYVGILVSEWYI